MLPEVEQEIDLESADGRALLLEEIEDLALTCDTADDAEDFANGVVYQLLDEIQSVLVEIDVTQAKGEEITDTQVELVQELYDQLVDEVEIPTVTNFYDRPRRVDMILSDEGSEGSVRITNRMSVPEPVVEFEQPELETQPVVTATINHRLPEKQPKPEIDYQAEEQQRVRIAIAQIEKQSSSTFDSWLSDYVSPYAALGAESFAELAFLAEAPLYSRGYLELKQLLATKRVTYESFQSWVQYFDDMKEVVEGAEHLSFAQVIEEYLAIITEP